MPSGFGQGSKYATVAASQTDQTLSSGVGDVLDGVLIIPTTTSPVAVSVKDGSTSITLFNGGATSVADLKPFYVEIHAKALGAGWKITTGANVAAVAMVTLAL